ncbi:hypothetical protein ACJZ2D_001338 [Fusarium nematophilum]
MTFKSKAPHRRSLAWVVRRASADTSDVMRDIPNGNQNCTKHNVRCSFHDVAAQCESPPEQPPSGIKAESPPVSKPTRRWPAKIRAEVRQWRRSGVLPILDDVPDIQVTPALYSDDELCYIYHLASLYHQLSTMDANKLTILTCYAPSFFRIGSKSRLVMNALLALSAYQIAFSNNCCFARHRSYQYQMMAIQDLRQALGSFNDDRADEVLAASIALLWLSEDMYVPNLNFGSPAHKRSQSRSQISNGISTVLEICRETGFKSDLYNLISKSWVNRHIASYSNPTSPTGDPSLSVLHCIITQAQRFQTSLRYRDPFDENVNRLHLVIELAQDISNLDPFTPAVDERMRSLRDYALWVPVNGLLGGKDITSSLLVSVYLYLMVVQVYRQFPREALIEVGGDIVGMLEEMLRRVTASGTLDKSEYMTAGLGHGPGGS